MIEVGDRFEYDYFVKHGFVPLADWRRFNLKFELRVEIQNELFGAVNFQQENIKFYKWCWENNIQVCQETGKPLHYYSSSFISHIISKGSDRRMATDPRNINILSFDAHNMWEFGAENERKRMNIYEINMFIIKMLKDDYNIK